MNLMLRHPDGRIEPVLDLQAAVTAMWEEMPLPMVRDTLKEMRSAECFTAYGMRDGRIFFVDPKPAPALNGYERLAREFAHVEYKPAPRPCVYHVGRACDCGGRGVCMEAA